jgi:hypothetical protein
MSEKLCPYCGYNGILEEGLCGCLHCAKCGRIIIVKCGLIQGHTSPYDEGKRITEESKLNWHYYICRGCQKDGDAHMVSLQALLELCDKCYAELPKEWKKKRGGENA